ncbi:MAG: hypothetical protein JWM27_532 [Gemmatimonadetes bacterium]|nr:hypothetical protein [Gemmatimonadota bacterium]
MREEGGARAPFEAPLDDGSTLHAERLRDGRVALGTRVRGADGEWGGGELHLLPSSAAAALAGWLAPTVEAEWLGTVREHLDAQAATADALYGDEPGGLRRLGQRLLEELPPRLLARALVLLAGSIGPRERERLVDSINRTADFSEDLILRRRLAEEGDAFAYVIAAAAVFDALDADALGPRGGGG